MTRKSSLKKTCTFIKFLKQLIKLIHFWYYFLPVKYVFKVTCIIYKIFKTVNKSYLIFYFTL